MTYFHIPVLSKEIIETVNPQPGENVVDGTLGGGGHAELFLEEISPDGKLLGIDLDCEALAENQLRLKKYSDRVIFEKGNFVDFDSIKKKHNFSPINIFFLDLGFSSQQLNDDDLGISFLKNSPLDMRIGGQGVDNDYRFTAEYIINNWSEEKIKKILKDYGEEKYAFSIAKEIVIARKEKLIISTKELVGIISQAVPTRYKNQRIHFATKTFQAFRIAVNEELENLQNVLPKILENIEVGGRICIISFHSLEDRIVKNFFRREAKDCVCDVKIPLCVCGHKKQLEIITKKPVMATKEEIAFNPRSRSAKLRIAKKI
ncbi:MAG: 16S rRNA (cytosine(1402)-N(4))-methyltransferase RsmH [Candidatus Pacebacteria bacterium]|nr:16S rRNA (cytosine(1402)-N(4))-methyltransferase RsmH [Candidatus Paceibacterota bacterium]